MPVKIAINGFGRIGRQAFKRIIDNHQNLDIVAINDLADPKTLAYLLRYDSIYGIYNKPVKFNSSNLLIDGTLHGKQIQILSEKDPSKLPWKDLGIEIVAECTGNLTEFADAIKHIEAGAKKVVISAPSKSPEIPMFVLGVNDKNYDSKKDDIVSMGSCTTNCLAPIAKILHEHFEIVRGFMTTTHSYTNDQRILDLAHKDLRRARAAGLNIIPTTTGAASAIGKVIPEIEGKLDGIALRVPTPTVSILDLICEIKKPTTAADLNYIFKKASEEPRFRGILGIEDAPLVSSDYKGNSFSAIVDSSLTMAKDNLVKVVAWYDNEWAYACRLAEFADYVAKQME